MIFSRTRRRRRYVWIALLLAWFGVGAWGTLRPLPPGTNVHSETVAVDPAQLEFLADLTYVAADGVRRSEQEIFDAVFALIDAAEHFIVADFFLLNESMGAAKDALRPLSSELVERLLARKAAKPDLRVLLITDPVNEIYGGARLELFDRLRDGGIEVVTTDLTRLRDSNPAYSALWRMFIQWWGNSARGGVLANPFGAPPPSVSLRSWLALLNFKANHRKVIVADRADGQVQAIVTSANPHDASSAHSNVALRFEGPLAVQVARNELAVAQFSGWQGTWSVPAEAATNNSPAAGVQLTVLTEAAIREHLLQAIAGTDAGDRIQIAMFYLADRSIVRSLLRAADRGVQVQLVLDPNKDAFGRQKDGVPNRPVAHELVTRSQQRIEVRWYATTGEQFHTKLTLITHGGRLIASLGSANLTRRNLGNYNLEANAAIELPVGAPLAQEMLQYFERLWSNDGGQYTLPFDAYDDPSRLRYWRYRLMEATGLSTF
jgi:phosphatidylserine/phosphatidylglycerophosphate/cardiolipin synthase-like enzyme